MAGAYGTSLAHSIAKASCLRALPPGRRRGSGMPSRRAFLGSTAAGVAGAMAARAPAVRAALRTAGERRALTRPSIVKPPRLQRGDAVGLINPCSLPLEPGDLEAVRDGLAALGLRLKEAPRVEDSSE